MSNSLVQSGRKLTTCTSTCCFTLIVIKSSCPAKALVSNSPVQSGRNPPQSSHSWWRCPVSFSFFVLVWLFDFVSGSFQAVYTKITYSSPAVSFFLVNCFCLHKISVVHQKYACNHAMTALIVQYIVRVLYFSVFIICYHYHTQQET